ncbi:KIF17 protein, partial [Thryothorus ludovicianus]|nr:KIF17 protein [Thryothorus ludovicianus]
VEGCSGTIQTGSGKPFTVQGAADPFSQQGLIPRAFEHNFGSVQPAESAKFLLGASCPEIYNEHTPDLQGAGTKQKLE